MFFLLSCFRRGRWFGGDSSRRLQGSNFILILHKIGSGVGNKVSPFHERFQSSYAGSFARRVRDAEVTNDITLLKELYRSDAEGVIRLFESQPSLHSNSSALSEYVKALVKVDRLDESSLFKTLQRGVTSSSKAEIFSSVAALKNVGQVTQDGILGTASTPTHMVTAETGHFKEQLWRTFLTIALTFLLISGVGALVEDRGISKGLGLQEEVQPTMESGTKFNDVKGVDEAKGELEEIVHYLHDPKEMRTVYLT